MLTNTHSSPDGSGYGKHGNTNVPMLTNTHSSPDGSGYGNNSKDNWSSWDRVDKSNWTKTHKLQKFMQQKLPSMVFQVRIQEQDL